MELNTQDVIAVVLAVLLVAWAVRALARLAQAIALVVAAYVVISVLRHPGGALDALRRQAVELYPLALKVRELVAPYLQELLRRIGVGS